MTSRTASSRVLTAAALAVTLPLLAGCQAFGINEQYSARYANYDDAMASWDKVQVPMLVPADAEDVRISYNTIDEGAILGFTSPGGLVADYCEPGVVDSEPAFEPGWWPDTEIPGEGYTCGDWSVVTVDGQFITWN